jgi:hypothetical protein
MPLHAHANRQGPELRVLISPRSGSRGPEKAHRCHEGPLRKINYTRLHRLNVDGTMNFPGPQPWHSLVVLSVEVPHFRRDMSCKTGKYMRTRMQMTD